MASSISTILALGFLFVSLVCGHDLPQELQPPIGNSLKITTKTSNGHYVYKCEKNKWIPMYASAELSKPTDSKSILGNYTFHPYADPAYAGKWALKNRLSDYAESGSLISVIAGREIASYSRSPNTRNILVEASYHLNNETGFYQISYIQGLYIYGKLPEKTKNGYCYEDSKVEVPFEAEFRFFTQDLEPPTVPDAIKVQNAQMVEGFFCKGTVGYTFDGHHWKRTSMQGNLYNVPGGTVVGSYFTEKPDANGGRFCLQTMNPYSWRIVAKVKGTSVLVGEKSLPWSLFEVTSSSGDVELLGPFRYYHLIGTRGGLPSSTEKYPKRGETSEVEFSGQFWVYK